MRSGRSLLAAAAGLALVVPLVALAAARRDEAAAPSFTRDVAPIFQDKCAGCHRLGGIAPFSLESAAEARRRAPLIAAAVGAGVMPPWPPGPKSPEYVGEHERTLSGSQRRTVLRWARAGGKVDGPARRARPAAELAPAPGETLVELRLPRAYAPRSRSTDDYRCFLLDPKLTEDVFVTGAQIRPGSSRVVHHVILFRVGATQVAEAQRLDAAAPGQGWTCFGGTGLSTDAAALGDAGWISAWAPGSGGGRFPQGIGIPLGAGSRVIMQVHYNLLNGRDRDRSSAVLSTAPATAALTPASTTLLPAPVELACGKGERGRLCRREAAIADLVRRFGAGAAWAPPALLAFCGRNPLAPAPRAVTSCDRPVTTRTTIHAVAGHMHLLGSAIRIELNPGSPRARILLDIPRWDFHWQSAYTLAEPVVAQPGDVVRVTCRHDVRKRGTHGGPPAPRYVVWGEGTGDEMCLGVIQVTRS